MESFSLPRHLIDRNSSLLTANQSKLLFNAKFQLNRIETFQKLYNKERKMKTQCDHEN